MSSRFVRTILCAIAASAVLAGCVKEVEQPNNIDENLHEVVFHAGWGAETKTALQEDGSVFWSPGDEISLFTKVSDDGGYCLTTDLAEPAASASFHGEIDNANHETFWATYPYRESNSFNGNELVVELPSHQVAKEGGIDDGLFISVSRSTGTDLKFYNVCGGVKFSVSQEGISQVILQSATSFPDGLALAGKLHVTFMSDGTPEITSIEDGSDYIFVDAPDGGTFKVGKWYYIIAAPTTRLEPAFWKIPFKISYRKGNEIAVYSTANIIKRSVFGKLSNKDEGLQFIPWIAYIDQFCYLNYDPSSIEYITFHVNSAITDGEKYYEDNLGYPFYADINGNRMDVYTLAPTFGMNGLYGNGFFRAFSSLKEVDMSNIDLSGLESAGWMFYGSKSLKKVVFGHNTGSVKDMSSMFYECDELGSVDFSKSDLSAVENVKQMFYNCRKLQLVIWDTNEKRQIKNAQGMFWNCASLERLDFSTFDTAGCEDLGEMFSGCLRLKQLDARFNLDSAISLHLMFQNCQVLEKVVFSQNNSPHLTDLDGFVNQCRNIKLIDLGGMNPLSESTWTNVFSSVAGSRNKFVIVAPDNVKNTILAQNMDTYRWFSNRVVWVKQGDEIPDVDSYRTPGIYYSSDYSMDDEVVQLQQASRGKGVDLYFMGDGYSDRLIESGQYEADMKTAIEALFKKEPLHSLRDCFNLYMVYCVSPNEHFNFYMEEHDPDYLTKFGTELVRNSVEIKEDYNAADYLRRIIPGLESCRDLTAIVILNEESGRGTAYLNFSYTTSQGEFDDLEHNGFGNGDGRAYVCRSDSDGEFEYTVAHEFGHAFAKLGDEYWYDDSAVYPSEDPYIIDHYKAWHAHGWMLNLSLYNDPTIAPWANYLADSRYAETGVGMFEGGDNYGKGIWRSTEDSMMRSGGEFNVISRQAIYNRVNKLAFGTQWQFDYETFVQQDLKNIPSATSTASVKSVPCPARVNRKPLFKMEESTTPDGKKMVTVIMN